MRPVTTRRKLPQPLKTEALPWSLVCTISTAVPSTLTTITRHQGKCCDEHMHSATHPLIPFPLRPHIASSISLELFKDGTVKGMSSWSAGTMHSNYAGQVRPCCGCHHLHGAP